MKSFNHLVVLASVLLGAVNSVTAQCSSSDTDDNQDQESLCNAFCTVRTSCKTQCIEKPSNDYTDCFCQDVCTCAREICLSCCTASNNAEWCDTYDASDVDYCSSVAGILPADSCYVYANTTYDATSTFPSSIESFLEQIPLPTGVTFASQSCDSSSASATAEASTAAASAVASSSSPSSSAATSASSSSSSSPKSTDGTSTASQTSTASETSTTSQPSSTAKSSSAAGLFIEMTTVAMAILAAGLVLV